jgi:hypothetical protein
MAFIVMFVFAMLLVPIIADIQRHGSNNILRLSARDILHFEWVIALRNVFGGIIQAAVALLIMFALAYILLKLVVSYLG